MYNLNLRKGDAIEIIKGPRISWLSLSQLASEGRSGSAGRTRDNEQIAAADRLGPRSHDQMLGRDGIDATTICNRRLLSI
jgi:hypothetical protein